MAATSWANLPLSGQHYPNGAEDFVVGALPPPGVYTKVYTGLIQKDRLTDKDGNTSGMPDLNVDVSFIVPRFIWVTPWKLFGASVASQVFFELYTADVESAALGFSDVDDSGVGDLIFTPLALGWHFGPNFHVILAEDVFAPIGDYDANDPASQILAKNNWTFETVLAATYLWKGFDASIKLMYDFNTQNDDYNLPTGGGAALSGDLDPGQELHIDWALSYAAKEGLRYGLSGYSYWQTSKDEFRADAAGIPTIKGDEGQIHAIGPTIKYWPNQGRFSAVLKHQWEFGAEALPEGQATWVNVVWAF
jgi:hypothetical protein